MKSFILSSVRGVAPLLLVLVFASGICVALVALQVCLTRNVGYVFLAWNLFLAWLPLVLALRIRVRYLNGQLRGWPMYGLAAAWLLLFPNAPYIFTDLSHLLTTFYGRFWVDLMLILLCALTGLIAGFISLYLLQSVVRDRLGFVAGWTFVLGVAVLSGVGVYIGRFLRLNSWDILHPGRFYHRVDLWSSGPMVNSMAFVLPALFAVFLFTGYLMFYATTKLPPNANISSR